MQFISLRLITLLFIALFFSATVNAQDSATPCGMEATAEGERVKAGSFEICPEDLAFQGSYLLWSDVFNDPFFKSIALIFTKEETLSNSFTTFADNQMGLSKITYPLLSAVAILCWMLIGPLLAFKGYQYFAMVQKTGSYQFGEGKGDTVKFVAYFLFLMMLIIPVNRIMMGQGLAIVLSLPSIMGGNFILSTYLNSISEGISDIKMEEDTLAMSSQGAANALVENELCQDRTRKALFSLNGAQFSDFYNGEFLFVNHNDVREVYSSCLSYLGLGKMGPIDNSLESISFNKLGSRQISCPKLDLWPGFPTYYVKDQHGYDHTCGKVTYNMGVDKYTSLLKDEHSELGDDMDDIIEDVMDSFKAGEYYSRHKAAFGNAITNIVYSEDMGEDEKYIAINETINNAANQLKTRLKSNPALSRGRTDELQFAHLGAGTALLGGTVEKGFLYLDFQRLIRNGIHSVVQSEHFANYYFPAHDLPSKVYGVDYLLEDARYIAELLQEYNCAMHWDQYSDVRLAITKFNTATQIRGNFAKGMPSMECVKVLSEKELGNSDTDRHWRYAVNDSRANADIVNEAGSTWIKSNENMAETQEYMSTVVAQDLYREIRVRQLMLTTYIASTQKALADSLAETLNQTLQERTSFYDLRSRGFATFGGTLLYLNKSQNSSNHMSSSIQEIFQVQSAGEIDTFIDTGAFPQAKLSELTGRINDLYKPLQTDGIFSIGHAGMMDHPGPQGISEDEEEEISMNNFLRLIERWTMGPLQHVKEAGGLPANKRLSEGLKECFDNGYSQCVSGHKHPMTALMQFGDETMNNMLNLMIVRAVVKVINRVVAGAGDGMEKGTADEGSDYDKHKKKSKSFFGDSFKKGLSFLKGAISRMLTLITIISIPAESLLDVLMPFAAMLMMVGALFAYLIPLTAYLYGFMLFALWMVGIAVVAFVIPFYALSKLFNIEKSYQRGFQDFYEGFAGPYLRPMFYGIAAVLAFSFMYIVVFVANTVFGLVYDGLSTSGGGFSLSGLMFEVLMYVMYLATILIMFRYALGIMKSFPDMMMSKLRLQRSNDEKFIDSLGFETYLNAKIIQEVTSNLNASVDKVSGGDLKERENLKAFKEFNKMIEDAGGADRIAEALNAINQQNSPNGQPASAPITPTDPATTEPGSGSNNTADQVQPGDDQQSDNNPKPVDSAKEADLPWAGPQSVAPNNSETTNAVDKKDGTADPRNTEGHKGGDKSDDKE